MLEMFNFQLYINLWCDKADGKISILIPTYLFTSSVYLGDVSTLNHVFNKQLMQTRYEFD